MSDAHTKLVGLIGWPIEHSLSPVMHEAAFSALGLNWRYLPLPVRPGGIKDAIEGLVALGFRGANVTIPYKQEVVPLLDELSPEAREIEAVNTIIIEEDGRIIGHNTDSSGFADSLRDSGFNPRGKTAIIVGAGGAARAAVHALLAAGIEKIMVLSRTLARAEGLIRTFGDNRLRSGVLSKEGLIEGARQASLLVNATPIGMWPHVNGSIWPDGAALPAQVSVFDLVYNPIETRLLKQARSSGAQAVSGIEMLIHQGAAAFELWTGMIAPIDVMRRALKERAN